MSIDYVQSLLDTGKPKDLTIKTKWVDLSPTFQNYLRTIPIRDEVSLIYVSRVCNTADSITQSDFLD